MANYRKTGLNNKRFFYPLYLTLLLALVLLLGPVALSSSPSTSTHGSGRTGKKPHTTRSQGHSHNSRHSHYQSDFTIPIIPSSSSSIYNGTLVHGRHYTTFFIGKNGSNPINSTIQIHNNSNNYTSIDKLSGSGGGGTMRSSSNSKPVSSSVYYNLDPVFDEEANNNHETFAPNNHHLHHVMNYTHNYNYDEQGQNVNGSRDSPPSTPSPEKIENNTTQLVWVQVTWPREEEPTPSTPIMNLTDLMRNISSLSPDAGISGIYRDSLENVEETFTYTLKRQNKNKFLMDKDIIRKSELLQFLTKAVKLKNGKSLQGAWTMTMNDDDDESDDSVNNNNTHVGSSIVDEETKKKVDQLEFNTNALLKKIADLESSLNTSNAYLKNLQSRAEGMAAKNDNAVQELAANFAIDKSRLEGQVSSLMQQLSHLNSSTQANIHNVSFAMRQINASVETLSHDQKTMMEMRVRFNQKALSSLDKTVDAHNDKMNDFILSSGGPRWIEAMSSGCGGILQADGGLLSYKFRGPYANNERCVWTLRVNRRPRVLIQLLEDGFHNSSHGNGDFLSVTEFTEDLTLVTSSRLEHGNKALHTFRGPLLFITFYSDGSHPGNGFMLKFKGQGTPNNSSSTMTNTDILNLVRYTHVHHDGTDGMVYHPFDRSSTYSPNELSTLVINPPFQAGGGGPLRVTVRYTDMEKEESCAYDSLTFYGSVKASYAIAKKYCEQQKRFNGEILQSADGTFIVIFRSDGSTQFKGFQFSWGTT